MSLKESDGTVKMSQTHLVDLAGSERASRSNATGDRLKEGAAINKGLSNLVRVISELAKNQTAGKTKSNPPFRDSKLTYVLKESLCGNSKTVMMAAISPSAIDHDETLSTMKFCQQAKLIRTKAVANTSNVNCIETALRHETDELRAKLASAQACLYFQQAGHDRHARIAKVGRGWLKRARTRDLASPEASGSPDSAEEEALLRAHREGRMGLILQRLEQTEQLSKFYGDNYDKWLAEEHSSIKKCEAEVDPNPVEQELRQQMASAWDGAGSDAHSDADGSDSHAGADASRDEYVLCRCLTRGAVNAGNLVSNPTQSLAGGDDDASKILVTGPIARELRSALGRNSGRLAHRVEEEKEDEEMKEEGSQTLVDQAAEHNTKSLARCWNGCIETESLVFQLSKHGAPKLVLIPHVAVRPDEIDLSCEVIVSAEYSDDGTAIREWFHQAQMEQLTTWLRDSLDAAGLKEGEHGTYDNAWETAVSQLTSHATRREVKEMQARLSMASQEILSERTKLAEASDEAAATEGLRRELAQQRAATTRLESGASETERSHASLVSEESDELRIERSRARQLQLTSESQSDVLDMQQRQLDTVRREAAEADGLRARAEVLRSELASAEDRLSASQRGREDAGDLHARLREAEGRLAFAETQARDADWLRAEWQQAEGRMRILQGRSDEAQRLRDELDNVQAQLMELSSQPLLAAPDGGAGELCRLRTELGAAESRLQSEGQSVADAERLQSALALEVQEASSMRLDAQSASGSTKVQRGVGCGIVISSFESAIDAIDLAKQELVNEASAMRRR